MRLRSKTSEIIEKVEVNASRTNDKSEAMNLSKNDVILEQVKHSTVKADSKKPYEFRLHYLLMPLMEEINLYAVSRRGPKTLLLPTSDLNPVVAREAPFMRKDDRQTVLKGQLVKILSVKPRRVVYLLCEIRYDGKRGFWWIPDEDVLIFDREDILIDFFRTLYFYHVNLFNSMKKKLCEKLRYKLYYFINGDCMEIKECARRLSQYKSEIKSRKKLL